VALGGRSNSVHFDDSTLKNKGWSDHLEHGNRLKVNGKTDAQAQGFPQLILDMSGYFAP